MHLNRSSHRKKIADTFNVELTPFDWLFLLMIDPVHSLRPALALVHSVLSVCFNGACSSLSGYSRRRGVFSGTRGDDTGCSPCFSSHYIREGIRSD